MTGFRLEAGGRIDRSKPLRATFDGKPLQAYAGDTLASALLASGIRIAAHSVMLGRPRGVYAAGVEEPNALIQVDEPWSEPMLTAPTVTVVDGLAASSLWGQGRLSHDPDPAAYDAVHHFCEVLVVGAGPAGLAAAAEAAARNVRVLLVDDRPAAGGALLTDAELAWAEALTDRLSELGVVHLQSTTAIGYYDDNYVVAVQRFGAGAPVRERVWRIRAGEVVLATGAHERPIVFAGNDVPGVMLAESVRSYLLRHGVAAGQRVVLFTAHDDTVRVERDLRAAGVEVDVVDARTGSVVTATTVDHDACLAAVIVRDADGTERSLPADVLAVSGGWNPAVHLYSHAGGRLAFDDTVGAFVPAGCRQRVTVIGAARGLRTTAACVADGSSTVPAPPADGLADQPAPAARLYLVAPAGAEPRSLETHFVDLQRDVSVADLARATGAGLAGVEHVKRYTTAGTAHDQGKTSGLLATAVIAELLGVEPSALGTTTYRPPYTPVAFATLAGRERGQLFDPVRLTGAHDWHVAHGAAWENVGQWKRPWFYPQTRADGSVEHLHEAVARECAAARTGVAFMDGSTLGKIEVQGPDAGAFLDRMYTNLMSSLKVGSIRYGVMCGVDGMVIDDGTVFRLAEDRFLLTTTTGNAAKIMDWLEEWLQTEWPELRAWCTSVTEQWATMAVVGPQSRALVGALAPELDVSQDAFGFMTWRDTTLAGLPARVARVSFSGELAYEINVAWPDAAALWDAVWTAGEPIGLTPYGTETMHVLRAEKGYPIVGQDTDGTITPQDLGMGWVVSKKKPDYLGKRSHARPDNARPDRRHLIGLLPVDQALVVPEGSQLVEGADLGAPPVPMHGFVTSSYFSAALGRPFALALLTAGRDRIGDTVYAVVDGVAHPVVVTGPVLVDPEGARRDGDPDVPTVEVGAVAPGRPVVPALAQVNLRVAGGVDTGLALPARTGEVTRSGGLRILGLGPDEYLVLDAADPEALSAQLRTAVAGHGSAVDLSATRIPIVLTDADARRLLRHGVPIDLDRYGPGTCAQTVLAQCAVTLLFETDTITLLVRTSFATHLQSWLDLTATAYG